MTQALDALIATHRGMFADDLHIPRLVTRQPPTTIDANTGVLHEEPAAATGMNMSGKLLKRLGHPEGYGNDFPWARALWKLKGHCRGHHPFHRAGDRPYWRGSLCHQLVAFVVVRGYSVENAARILRYDHPEPVLRQAFDFIEQTMDEFRALAEKRAREAEGHGPGAVAQPVVHEHHRVPGMHAECCPQCRAA